MPTLECTLEGFKKVVAEFVIASKEAQEDQLEAGLKCVQLHYFGITPCPDSGSYQEIIAIQSLEYASKKYFDRMHELFNQ